MCERSQKFGNAVEGDFEKVQKEKEKEVQIKRRLNNQKKGKRYREKTKRIAFSNEIVERFQNLIKKTEKTNSQFLSVLLENFEQNENKKEKKRKEKRKRNSTFFNIEEKTKFYLFPINLINTMQNKKILKIKENNFHHCCQLELLNEEENKLSIFNPSNMMDNNCVSKMDLKVVSSIFLSGLGYAEYMRLFSMLFVEKSLMCSNTFYAIQRSYIIPSIEEIWKQHQKTLLQNMQQTLQVYVDGRWSRPQRQKGSAEYLTEVLIDSKTHLVLGIETLCKDEKESGKGNEEAQCLLKMLESSPIKDVQIQSCAFLRHRKNQDIRHKKIPLRHKTKVVKIRHNFSV
ncbi:hypothetical protein M0813_12041 [Anaeramoeba flamelloides]|uniref:Uncharacterized protein n=1 Tax=Anaeramoeba flamelloides TaxID=1746091 RepID=A0ABQ8ZCX5_9EUKA|nr:hypothetical protein M0813_12041 [Anaeramoeba flamelloides]